MNKIIKLAFCFLMAAGLSSCMKIDISKLEGTWCEQYDPSILAMDSFPEYTFDGNNHYHLHIYHALTNESVDQNGTYAIDLSGKGTITLNPEMSNEKNATYKIVKLTSEEMAWQLEGTEYTLNSWGTNYRRFVRSK